MALVVLDLATILTLAPPGAFYLRPSFKHSQKMFMRIPIIESLPMEHIIVVVTIIILLILEYFKCQPVSSAVLELAVVDVSVDPYAWMA